MGASDPRTGLSSGAILQIWVAIPGGQKPTLSQFRLAQGPELLPAQDFLIVELMVSIATDVLIACCRQIGSVAIRDLVSLISMDKKELAQDKFSDSTCRN
jgi:hypothetical protein